MDDRSDEKQIVKDTHARFFNNSFLESLTHSNPNIINIVFLPVIIYLVYLSLLHHSGWINFMGFGLGLVLWSLAEYLIHRFLFHYRFEKEAYKEMHSILHLAHHKYIRDASKFNTIPIVSVLSGILFYFIFKWIFGGYYEPIFAGFSLGYFIYEHVHLSTHTLNMNRGLWKILKRNHMQHHYLNNKKNFGVTSPLWDHVFKTRFKRKLESTRQLDY